MTEAEWLASNNPRRMLEPPPTGCGSRRLKLIALACCRDELLTRLRRLGLLDARSLAALRVFERHVDGAATPAEVAAAAAGAWDAARAGVDPDAGSESISDLLERDALQQRIAQLVESGRVSAGVRGGVLEAVIAIVDGPRRGPSWATFVRDIVGNPFRPVGFNPRWLTSDVVDLARAIYAERAFERLPILADALTDAGCDDEQVIAHCRSDGPHVRGCWVIDLLLGNA